MIKITHNRMLASAVGLTEDILDATMTYNHKSMERKPVWQERGGYTKMVERQVSEKRDLYTTRDNTVIFQQGLLTRLTDYLDKHKIKYEYEDVGKVECIPDFGSLKKLMPDVAFRENQDTLIGIVMGLPCGQIVAPAALGKTFCITVLCALYPDKNILVVTPGAQLTKDTCARMVDVFGKNNVGMLGAGGSTVQRVTVSTYQSAHKYPPAKADIIFVDESHKSAQATLSTTLAKFVNVEKIFGFTASPVGRSDGAELVTEALLGPVRLNVSYDKAMKAGVVAPMKVMLVDVSSGPDEKLFKANVTKQRHLLWTNVYRNKVIANAVNVYTDMEANPLGLKDPQVLILVGTSTHLEKLSKLLPDYALVYKSTGKTKLPKLSTKQLDETFAKFKSREIKKVIATGCWGTGVDFPDMDIIVMASGKSNPIDVIQYTGRCTRTGTGEKEFGYVVDFKDSWSWWAKNKAKKRLKLYKEMGWRIYD